MFGYGTLTESRQRQKELVLLFIAGTQRVPALHEDFTRVTHMHQYQAGSNWDIF